jgi:predicted transcriptional regulator
MSLLRKDGLIVNEARGAFKITKAGLNESKKA